MVLIFSMSGCFGIGPPVPVLPVPDASMASPINLNNDALILLMFNNVQFDEYIRESDLSDDDFVHVTASRGLVRLGTNITVGDIKTWDYSVYFDVTQSNMEAGTFASVGAYAIQINFADSIVNAISLPVSIGETRFDTFFVEQGLNDMDDRIKAADPQNPDRDALVDVYLDTAEVDRVAQENGLHESGSFFLVAEEEGNADYQVLAWFAINDIMRQNGSIHVDFTLGSGIRGPEGSNYIIKAFGAKGDLTTNRVTLGTVRIDSWTNDSQPTTP